MALTAEEMQQVIAALLPLIRPQSQPSSLGTVLDVKQHDVNVTTGNLQPIVTPDPNRVLIAFFPAPSSPWVVSTNPGTVAASGWTISTTSNPQVWTVAEHGTLPQQGWYGGTTGATQRISWIEIVYRQK